LQCVLNFVFYNDARALDNENLVLVGVGMLWSETAGRYLELTH